MSYYDVQLMSSYTEEKRGNSAYRFSYHSDKLAPKPRAAEAGTGGIFVDCLRDSLRS